MFHSFLDRKYYVTVLGAYLIPESLQSLDLVMWPSLLASMKM